MKRAAVESSRVEEVREAAAGWKRAGFIDAAALAVIEAEYPDARINLHRVWRILVVALVSVAVIALFWSAFDANRPLPILVYAIALAGATDWLAGSRFSATGAHAATSFWALVFLIWAAGVLFSRTLHVEPARAATLLLAATCAAGAAAAWRWGFWLPAAIGAGAFFALLGRYAGGRALWAAVAVGLMAVTIGRLDRGSIAPPHRRGLAAIFAVSAAALYVALNLYSLDRMWVETIRQGTFFAGAAPFPRRPSSLRILSILATATLPAAFLAWGVVARRTILLAIGIVASALSVGTFRQYVPIGPRSAFLAAYGVALVGAALWIHRRLREAPAGAWRGLTASPLFSKGDEGVSPLAAIGGLASGAVRPGESELATGGGEFGGGGASGRF